MFPPLPWEISRDQAGRNDTEHLTIKEEWLGTPEAQPKICHFVVHILDK